MYFEIASLHQQALVYIIDRKYILVGPTIMAAGCDSNSTATSLEDQSDDLEDNPTRDTLTEVSISSRDTLTGDSTLNQALL